jgi:mannose/cellobiose epimerase-like protein (N-acyl-D-glucosamine 2-epimerase family)
MSLNLYQDWLRNTALPFWLQNAADDSGLFYETYGFDGTPQSGTPLRLRTGMRQIYVMAEAAGQGLCNVAQASALAHKMFLRLHGLAWAPDGQPGWAKVMDRDGKILDSRRDLYDHAFVDLALSALIKLKSNIRYDKYLTENNEIIESLKSSEGGWHEDDTHIVPRRQNPHMHLFEASLALYEATGDGAFRARADDIYQLFLAHFIDSQTGFLREFFGTCWEVTPELGSDRYEPGHMAEWAWLLARYRRLGGEIDPQMLENLLANAERIGRDKAGFLIDEVAADGHTLLDRRRLWPQTEYLKALLNSSRPGAREQADQLAGKIIETYLSGVAPGCWRDAFSLDGHHTAKNVPASILYHLFSVFPEI